MKRYLMFGLLLVALPLIAATDEFTASHLVNPPNSGLTLVKVSEDPVYQIKFSGKVWVSGTFRAEWHPDNNDSKPGYILALAIKPDQADTDRLPYLGDDKIDLIWIENKKGLVQMVFSKDMASRLLSGDVQVAEVHGRFLLTNYYIGECGSPWASAQLVSVRDTEEAKIGAGLVIGDC